MSSIVDVHTVSPRAPQFMGFSPVGRLGEAGVVAERVEGPPVYTVPRSLLGAAVGGGLGAVAGGVVGHARGEAGKSALLWGAAGAVLGGVVGPPILHGLAAVLRR